MKISNLAFNLFILFLILFAGLVKAEYCDMLGCNGDKRWIYIPKSQYEHNKASKLNVDHVEYEFDRSNRLFKEDELPKIGQSVTLNVNILSFGEKPESSTLDGEEKERWLKIKSVEKSPFIYNVDNKVAFINDTAYEGTNNTGASRGNWDFNADMVVKILNYQHVDNVLFAWVEVEKS